MKPLYLNPAVHSVLPDALRPGGAALTRKLTERVQIEGKTVVDAGCGRGTSLALLQQYKPKLLVGLDIQTELLRRTAGKYAAIQADMASIPLQTGSVDLVLAECAWNMSRQQPALAEFHRILRPDGTLALSDIFRRNSTAEEKREKWPLPCCFAAAKTAEEIKKMLLAAGFVPICFTDHSRLLKESAARFIFEFGSLQKFWQAVCGGTQGREDAEKACSLTKTMMPGLFFLLARRAEKKTL